MKAPLHLCPVCGLKGLKEPPYDSHGVPSHEICPRCGFEFGFDPKESMVQFHEAWLRKGSPWFVPSAKPEGLK